jgi:ComF family protein
MNRAYFSSRWQSISARLLDMVYPPSCELCETPQIAGRYLCDDCRNKLPRVESPFCQKCGEMFEGNISTAFLCPNCTDLDYAFSFARPVLLSSDAARHLVHIFKYGKAIHLARELALLAAEAFDDPRLQRALAEKWTLVPVPLHWARKQHRHFNQSEEIARHLGKILGLPMIPVLNRVRATPTQTNLSRKQRLQNLRGAIQISARGRRWLKGGAATGIILIDDVFTTGATVQECAQVLRKNLQENIVVVTVVRG